MAPSSSGPAPRMEPGSACTQFIDSEPFDGIDSGAGAAAAAAFRRPPVLRAAALLAARQPSSDQPPFCAPAFFAPTLRPAFLRPAAFFGAALRPTAFFVRRPCCAAAFFGAALRPAAFFLARPSCGRRHASPSPVRAAVRWLVFRRCSPVGTPSGVVGCCRAVDQRPPMQPGPHQACRYDRIVQAGQLHRAGDPAWVFVVHARQCRTCPEARRRGLAHLACCAAVFVASAIQHLDVDARSAVLHLDWSAVNGPSFCCRVRTLQRLLRIECTHTESAIPRLAHACQQKATVSSQVRRKKCVHDAMRCIDVTENRRDIAAAAVCSVARRSLSDADRSARTARSRGLCSWLSDGSACCRCAVP